MKQQLKQQEKTDLENPKKETLEDAEQTIEAEKRVTEERIRQIELDKKAAEARATSKIETTANRKAEIIAKAKRKETLEELRGMKANKEKQETIEQISGWTFGWTKYTSPATSLPKLVMKQNQGQGGQQNQPGQLAIAITTTLLLITERLIVKKLPTQSLKKAWNGYWDGQNILAQQLTSLK